MWHYVNSEKYDKSTKTGSLFTLYVNMFLKYKQEASCSLGDVVTDVEIQAYIDEYHVTQGIYLEKNNIKKNTGL